MAGETAQSVAAHQGARYGFRLANQADEAALRQLLRETPMDGPVRVTLRREPDYFAASVVDGPCRQTLVVTDLHSQCVVGMGCRSIRPRYVDGQAAPVGYLSGLRILPEHRSGTVLVRGYQALRRLHEDGATDYYLTTIADGNRRAVAALTGSRARMPTYFPVGTYHTFVIPLRPRLTSWQSSDLEIRPLSRNEVPQLIDFIAEMGKSKCFLPCYTQEDFCGPQATFPDLATEDILAAWRGSQLVATLGLWDQSRFRQTVVEGYRGPVRWSRGAFNVLACCWGWPRFPACGQPTHSLVAALPLAREGQASAFHALLKAAGDYVRQRQPGLRSRSLLVGSFERDPLLLVCQGASLFRYDTQVFLVYWDESSVRPERFALRDLYLELGCL